MANYSEIFISVIDATHNNPKNVPFILLTGSGLVMELQRAAGRTCCHIVRQKRCRHGRVCVEVGHPRGSHLHLVRIGRERSLSNAGIEGRRHGRYNATRSGAIAQPEQLLDGERRPLWHGLWRARGGSWSCYVNCLGPSYRVQIHCLLHYTIH